MKIHELLNESSVVGSINWSRKNLTTLKGCPAKCLDYLICDNNNLESLNLGPSYIGGFFSCKNNKLESLSQIHKHIKFIGGVLDVRFNPLTKNLLGLILIDGLIEIRLDNKNIAGILNKYLLQSNKKRAMLQCQQELIEAGFDEAAQL